jgi:O-antigen/teichoic acid export membrane protein
MSTRNAVVLKEDLDGSHDGGATTGSLTFDSTLRNVLFRSLSWTGAARVAASVGVVVRYVIFARLLRPFDFGVIGAANLALMVAFALTSPSFDSALVAQHDEVNPYLDTVWVTMFAQAIVIALVLILLSHPLSEFFRISEAYRVFWAISPVALLSGLRSPASGSRIYRKMDFRISFVLTAAEQMAGFVFGLAAILWFGDWRGLIVAMYGQTLARSAGSFWYFPYKPGMRFDSARFRKMFAYGRWITVRGLATYISHNLDNLVVAHLLGPRALGEYQMAFRLAEVPATEVGGVAGLVSFPLVSRIGNERMQRWRLFVWTSVAVALVGSIYILFVLRFGPVLIARTVGPKWLGAVPPLKLLCFYGLGQGLMIIGTHFLDGLGMPEASFRITLIATLALGVLIYPLTASFGSVGAATAAVAAVTLPLPIMCKLCRDATRKSTG